MLKAVKGVKGYGDNDNLCIAHYPIHQPKHATIKHTKKRTRSRQRRDKKTKRGERAMRLLVKYILLGLFLLMAPGQLAAYNNSWSNHEDVTKPCPGPGCEKPCRNLCGCEPDGTPKACDECDPLIACCAKLPPPHTTSSPVYTRSRLFTWSDTDISLAAKPSIILKRNYTAYEPHLGLFGNAWISDFEKLFIETVKYNKEDNGSKTSEIRCQPRS